MRSEKDLIGLLNRIDGKGYGAYKQLKGAYEIGDFELFVDYVQGDPYAAPSRFRVRMGQNKAGFPSDLYQKEIRKIALEDYVTRRFGRQARSIARGNRGSGKSGLIQVADYGQAVLPRTSCMVNEDFVEVTFAVGLPARGRRPQSRVQAKEMIFDEMVNIASSSLLYPNLEEGKVKAHVETVEDAEFIRRGLEDKELVAFVANGSILPRESGIGNMPMEGAEAVAFRSPDSMEEVFQTPNGGEVAGMGIPEGVTLIVGGGYHGKSTLLDSFAQAVYSHIPGDGRGLVISIPDSVVIRAEDGRYVEKADISTFISNVPSGLDTSNFSTEDASGSTSQAANIVEALEAGARALLIDEDTSATNLMIRDERMQELVAEEDEPITPLIDRIGTLYREKGVSSILVMGGSGDYFDVADTVIQMKDYIPRDVTSRAKQIAEKYRAVRKSEGSPHIGRIKGRKPVPKSIDPRKRSGKVKIKARGMDSIQFGYQDIDLSRIHQISERPQARLIGDILFYMAKEIFDGETTVSQGLDQVETIKDRKGIHEFTPYNSGDLAMPRRYEIAAALNRLRSLACR